MAKKEARIIVTLVCPDCKSHNYTTEKSRRNDPERMALMKLCPRCGKNTKHVEYKK